MAVFKKPNTKKIKRREVLRDEEEEEDDLTAATPAATVSDLIAIQRLRKRPAGMSAAALAYGDASGSLADHSASASGAASHGHDPLGLQSGGGIIDLKKLKRSDWAHVNVEENLKQNFSRESHLRDEDEEMRRYVEDRLGQMTGKASTSAPGRSESSSDQRSTPADSAAMTEDDMYQLPEHMKHLQSKKNEEMLSQQMLSGIPEVDLGIEAKIKNIEETEAAKLRLLKETADKAKDVEQATTARQNLAKELSRGYVQHDRYKIDWVTNVGSGEQKPDRVPTQPMPVVDEDTPRWVLMEKTPSGVHNRRPIQLLAKPTDEQLYKKMKDKILKADSRAKR